MYTQRLIIAVALMGTVGTALAAGRIRKTHECTPKTAKIVFGAPKQYIGRTVEICKLGDYKPNPTAYAGSVVTLEDDGVPMQMKGTVVCEPEGSFFTMDTVMLELISVWHKLTPSAQREIVDASSLHCSSSSSSRSSKP